MTHFLRSFPLALLLLVWLAACSQASNDAASSGASGAAHTTSEETQNTPPETSADENGNPNGDENGNPDEGDPQAGWALFHGEVTPENVDYYVACKTCHYINADEGVLIGPNLAGVHEQAATRVPGQSADEYLRRSIISHDEYVVEGFEEGLMLSVAREDFGELLTDEQINNLMAYLKTLEVDEQNSSPEAAAPTVEPGESLTPDSNGYVGIAGAYRLQPVDGWQARIISGSLVVQPPDSNLQTGPFIAMRSGAIEEMNIPNEDLDEITTTETFFSVMLQNFIDETYAITLTDRTTIEIGGMPAQVANVRGFGFGDLQEGEVAGRLAVAMVDETHSFFMLGMAASPDDWAVAAEFDTMLQSVQFESSTASSGGAATPTMLHYSAPLHVPAASGLAAHADAQAAQEIDRNEGPRFACVSCHVTHDVEMLHDSNPSCNICHVGTPYQRHCVDCHSIHDVDIPHEPDSPGCEGCHAQGIPGDGTDAREILLIFFEYLYHDI